MSHRDNYLMKVDPCIYLSNDMFYHIIELTLPGNIIDIKSVLRTYCEVSRGWMEFIEWFFEDKLTNYRVFEPRFTILPFNVSDDSNNSGQIKDLLSSSKYFIICGGSRFRDL